MATSGVAAVEEKRWREENDVRTLAEAEKIKADKGRFDAASRRAKAMAEQAELEAKAVKNVANKNVNTPPKGRTQKRATRTTTVSNGKGGGAKTTTKYQTNLFKDIRKFDS